MTATERAKRSDALYYETVSVTRRVLCDMIANREADLEELRAEFDKMDKWHSAELQAAMAENANLREQMERLVTLLRVDCDIDASWDGLRRFWSIGLTEDGCLMRDRACKAEVDNAKLREQVDAAHMSRLLTENENEKLRELCADMLHDAMENICSKAHWCDEKSWQTCNDEKCGNRLYVEMARELGIEVDE